MKYLFFAILTFVSTCAESSLHFKKEPQGHSHLLIYVMFFILISAFLFYLTQRQKKQKQSPLLERFDLNSKTKAYVIEVKGQHFLIAEHPQALAIHAIQPKAFTHDS